jgi:hypothetical protein
MVWKSILAALASKYRFARKYSLTHTDSLARKFSGARKRRANRIAAPRTFRPWRERLESRQVLTSAVEVWGTGV